MTSTSAARGVTLIELMIVTTILAILAVLAAPSFVDFIARNRIDAAANDMLTSINFARSEAIKRGVTVGLCRSADGASCAGAGGWEQGWVAFTDQNANDAVDGTDAVLQRWPALAPGYTFRGSGAAAGGLRYNPRGMAHVAAAAAPPPHLIVCRAGAVVGARALIITATRPRMAGDANGDRIPEDDAQANLTTCTPP